MAHLDELFYTSLDFSFQGLSNDLKRAPDTLENLKFVLRVIANIRDMSLDVELKISDIQERYRTLLMYELEVGQCGHNCFVTQVEAVDLGSGIEIVFDNLVLN